MQRMSVIANFQKCPRHGMVRVRSQDPPRGSDGVRGTDWCQFSKKYPSRGLVRVRTSPRGSGRVISMA